MPASPHMSRSRQLALHRRQLVTHWKTINAVGDDTTRQHAAAVLEHLAKSVSYAIDGRVCAQIYAYAHGGVIAAKPDDVRTPYGLAVFDTPYAFDALDVELRGFSWGSMGAKWWIVPLTNAGVLGLSPATSLCPMTTGYTLGRRARVTASPGDDTATASAVVIAMWKGIVSSHVQVVGDSTNRNVLVTHSHCSA